MLCHLCRSGSGLLALQSNPFQISCDFIAFHPTRPTTLPAGISISISTQTCDLGLCQYEFCQTQLCAERQIQFASHNPPNQPPDPASKGWTANHEQKTFESMQGESVCCLIVFRSHIILWWFMSCRLEACTSTNQFAFKQKDSWNSLSFSCHIPGHDIQTRKFQRFQETFWTQVSQQKVVFCAVLALKFGMELKQWLCNS